MLAESLREIGAAVGVEFIPFSSITRPAGRETLAARRLAASGSTISRRRHGAPRVPVRLPLAVWPGYNRPGCGSPWCYLPVKVGVRFSRKA